MDTIEKNGPLHRGNVHQQPITEVTQPVKSDGIGKKMSMAYQYFDKQEYQKAFDLLSSSGCDIEEQNMRAVCMMRLNRFEEAYKLLRPVAFRSNVGLPREGVPLHVWINLATSLYFGGRPAGALEILADARCEDHPAVQLVRQHHRRWVAEMSFLRRLDWRLNRVAPKQLPKPPNVPVGILSMVG